MRCQRAKRRGGLGAYLLGFEHHDRFLRSLGHPGSYAYGKVRLIGRVLRTRVNPDELRAERVQLVALYVPAENPSADVIASRLTSNYGVPAEMVRDIREIER
jgi:hypothetical protein